MYYEFIAKINAVQIHPMNENVLLCAGACTLSLHDIRRATGTNNFLELLLYHFQQVFIAVFLSIIGKSVSRDKALLYENTAAHSKSICSAGISPDGTVLVTLSSDNTMKLWTGDFCSKADGIRCAQSMRKNNHTGRWLSTFRHCFDPKYPNNFLVGSMELPRRMEIYSLHSSLTAFDHLCSLRAEDLKSVCSRNALHPTRNIVVGGNSSGRVHLFQ